MKECLRSRLAVTMMQQERGRSCLLQLVLKVDSRYKSNLRRPPTVNTWLAVTTKLTNPRSDTVNPAVVEYSIQYYYSHPPVIKVDTVDQFQLMNGELLHYCISK